MSSRRRIRPPDMLPAEVQAYVDAIDPSRRPLFDRVEGLIREAFPEVRVTLSYKMPTFVVGRRRLYVAAWNHGISLYGWASERDGGFSARHPELLSQKGTIRIRPQDAEHLTDDELRALVVGTLS